MLLELFLFARNPLGWKASSVFMRAILILYEERGFRAPLQTGVGRSRPIWQAADPGSINRNTGVL